MLLDEVLRNQKFHNELYERANQRWLETRRLAERLFLWFFLAGLYLGALLGWAITCHVMKGSP